MSSHDHAYQGYPEAIGGKEEEWEGVKGPLDAMVWKIVLVLKGG